jgi:Domain of unknown function DUF29
LIMGTNSAYETDFYSWTQEQVLLLKAGLFNELDTLNLIDEIEDMASNKRRELKTRLKVLLLHLLKWQYQPSHRGRSWTLTIEEQRLEIDDVLQENPGLKPEIPEQLKKAYKLGRIHAAKETGLDKNEFPEVCPWTFEQLIDDNFFPE